MSSLKYNPLWVTLYLANTIEDKLSENWQQSHFLLITYIQRAVKARTPPAVCAEPGPRVDWTCAHSGNMHTHRPTYLSWLMGGGAYIWKTKSFNLTLIWKALHTLWPMPEWLVWFVPGWFRRIIILLPEIKAKKRLNMYSRFRA